MEQFQTSENKDKEESKVEKTGSLPATDEDVCDMVTMATTLLTVSPKKPSKVWDLQTGTAFSR